MKQQFDRYFELLPLFAIILILVHNEHRRFDSHLVELERSNFELPAPSIDVQMPRVILR